MKTPIKTNGRASELADLNDNARQALACKMVVTRGIAALPMGQQMGIIMMVRSFSDFTQDNDPYGEHDFGAFDTKVGKVFFKFDYYDKACEYGSEDPADPAQTTRVLTIMFADEY
jgi:hypothetical protein